MQEKDFNKIEVQNNICINVFGYENELVYPVFISKQKFKDSLNLLLLNEDSNCIMSILKILTHSCFMKQKIKIKNGFVKVVYNALVVKIC